MTPFALLLDLAGLSQREAGAFLRVRIDTVKSWGSGRNPTPTAVLDDLRALIAQQRHTADQAVAQMAALFKSGATPDEIELGYPADDVEAQSMGWPCVGAWRGMAARVIHDAPCPILLVPRGSTPATAAAADAAKR